MNKNEVIEYFKDIMNETNKGIERLISNKTDEKILERLTKISDDPLTKVQFNQLLMLSHESGVSDGFFKYYWLSAPEHIYDVCKVDDYDSSFIKKDSLISLQHLKWGLRRVYIDSLLFFGSIKHGFAFFIV
jgi:hypothetical protein